jgi:hypothetical protein
MGSLSVTSSAFAALGVTSHLTTEWISGQLTEAEVWQTPENSRAMGDHVDKENKA